MKLHVKESKMNELKVTWQTVNDLIKRIVMMLVLLPHGEIAIHFRFIVSAIARTNIVSAQCDYHYLG